MRAQVDARVSLVVVGRQADGAVVGLAYSGEPLTVGKDEAHSCSYRAAEGVVAAGVSNDIAFALILLSREVQADVGGVVEIALSG